MNDSALDPGLRWLAIGPPTALRFAPGAVVEVEGLEVAVFQVASAPSGYRAILNSCPHAGAALAEGHVDGDQVSCPWHGWRFDLSTGACRTCADDATRVFPVRLVDGVLELGLDP